MRPLVQASMSKATVVMAMPSKKAAPPANWKGTKFKIVDANPEFYVGADFTSLASRTQQTWRNSAFEDVLFVLP